MMYDKCHTNFLREVHMWNRRIDCGIFVKTCDYYDRNTICQKEIWQPYWESAFGR